MMARSFEATKRKSHKLLVANRSEIACRVFQACRELGISTAAIYAPGDESARHVTFADEAYAVKGYLDIASIVEVARKVGATMIHPGYGFLSERASFAKAVEEAGIAFVGPRAETIELMGGKIAAKELCERIGVPTLPWSKAQGLSAIQKAADEIGYPVLLKAAAGGGGKGMRKVSAKSELKDAAESAQAEAQSAFGDGTLFVEKLVEKPRHIEIQVFGDGKGGGIHLNERDCSLQRRHQKVWEEAPAVNLSDKAREGLFEAALRLVKETKYRSAGTLEFLVEGDAFYFLEMNTRLQVEHPVTESVTGMDLVHAQLELAMGLPAPAQIPKPRGHSIEVRLYAEDPAQGFMPTPGEVRFVRWPAGPGIRVDSGIEVGQVISTQFDSMLAKIIVTAPTREKAIARMKYALEETVVLGVGTNQAYLLSFCDDARIRSMDVYTQYLEKEFRFDPIPSDEVLALVAAKPPASRTDGSSAGSRQSDGVSPWNHFAHETTLQKKGASK